MQIQKTTPKNNIVQSFFKKNYKIPKNWKITNLENIVKKEKFAIVDGPFGTQLHSDEYVESGIPLVNVNNIDRGGRFVSENIVYISDEKFDELKRSMVLPNDLVLAKTGATIGKVTLFPSIWKKGLVSSRCAKISVDPKIADFTYVFYFLFSKMGYSQIISRATATTMPGINLTDIKTLKIILPDDLKEQQKIASIISNVDSLIQKTQQIIEQTRKVKKGLIEKLLTKGIGHTKSKKVKNFFRNDMEIPEKWDYPKFSEVVRINPQTKIAEKQVPYLPMDAIDVEKPHFNYFEERMLNDFPSLPKFQENDVLFASITPSTENGKTCIVENFSRKGIGSSELTILRASDKVVPKYLYYYVKSHRIRQFAISQMMGTTGRQRVPDYVFKKDLNFELPPYPEQQKIASILSEIDSEVQKHQECKSNLENLKKGLMQKLLTGQIRVKV